MTDHFGPKHLAREHQHGRLTYRHEGRESGREWWRWTRNGDGTETLRAYCETDATGAQRDITFTADEHGRPREAFVRLQVSGQWVGSGVYRVGPDQVVADLWGPNRPVERQRQRLSEPAVFFPRCIALAGWHCRTYDPKLGGRQHYQAMDISSPDHGDDGPSLCSHPGSYELLEEAAEITVPAGAFRCFHFQVFGTDPEEEPRQLWLESEKGHLVYLDWPGRGEFELASLATPEP